MSERPTNEPLSLNLTDEEFVGLHAAASAEGLEINDFIVATLRQHAQVQKEIETHRSSKQTGSIDAG